MSSEVFQSIILSVLELLNVGLDLLVVFRQIFIYDILNFGEFWSVQSLPKIREESVRAIKRKKRRGLARP
jgi:hypothetical protein